MCRVTLLCCPVLFWLPDMRYAASLRTVVTETIEIFVQESLNGRFGSNERRTVRWRLEKSDGLELLLEAVHGGEEAMPSVGKDSAVAAIVSSRPNDASMIEPLL